MTSGKVYEGVRRQFNNHDHKFENVYIYPWECDHFSVTSSGYAYEVEVKVSKSDFKADFQKAKHHFFKTVKNGFAILPQGHSHEWTKEGKFECYNIKPMQVSFKNCPNVFYFACPVGLIEAHEVPKYAGLIYVMDGYGDPRIIKKAPYIHKDKFDPSKMLFDKYMWGYINQKRELEDANRILARYKKQYDDTTTEPKQLIYF